MAGDKVRIAVDPETGDMEDRAFMSCWTMVREHPDTGAALVGLKLPLVRECVEIALRMHARWPLPRFVSWDMLPDHQGRVQVPFCMARTGPTNGREPWRLS